MCIIPQNFKGLHKRDILEILSIYFHYLKEKKSISKIQINTIQQKLNKTHT